MRVVLALFSVACRAIRLVVLYERFVGRPQEYVDPCESRFHRNVNANTANW